MLLLLPAFLILIVPNTVSADERTIRNGYKYNDYPQDRLRFIATNDDVPTFPVDSNAKQHAFQSEAEYRFFENLNPEGNLYLTGLFFAQVRLGHHNSVGIHTKDGLFTSSSYSDKYYLTATFPELYFGYELEETTLEAGFINPVYGYSALPVSDVFSKSRQILGLRKGDDATTELRQGNLGFRFNKIVEDDEFHVIYMPDIEKLHNFSNFGHRLFGRWNRQTEKSEISVFGLYQTRDNYDGPYTSIRDVKCCEDFALNVPKLREINNLTFGADIGYSYSDKLTLYGEVAVSKEGSKFDVTQVAPIVGGGFNAADANSEEFNRVEGPFVKFTLGTQYSLSTTSLIRTEYHHNQNGYNKDEQARWTSVLGQALTSNSLVLLGDLRDHVHTFGTFSQNYLHVNYENRFGANNDNTFTLGAYLSIDDHSTLMFAGTSYGLTENMTLNARATFLSGKRRSDFGSLGERLTFSLYLESMF